MSKTRAAAGRLEWLEKDRVEKPWQPWELQLDLAPEGRSGELVVALEDAVLERGSFRLGPIDLFVSWGERVSVAGANGSGKTTLLDALLGRLPLSAGPRRVGPSVVFGEVGQARALFPGAESLLSSFCAASGLPPGEARALLASSTSTRRTCCGRQGAFRRGSGRVPSLPSRPPAVPAASSSTSPPIISTYRRSRSWSVRSASTTGRCFWSPTIVASSSKWV